MSSDSDEEVPVQRVKLNPSRRIKASIPEADETEDCRCPKHLTPEERLGLFIHYVAIVEVDPKISCKFYFNTGFGMKRRFDKYLKQGNLEEAFAVYLKASNLFWDRIKKHPNYNKVPINIISQTSSNISQMRTKAVKIKRDLLQKYKDVFNSYCKERRHNKNDISDCEETKRNTLEDMAEEEKSRVRDFRSRQSKTFMR